MTNVSAADRQDAVAQTSWSIRIPCPGGRGARTVGWDALASSALPSVLASGVLVSMTSGAFTGLDAAMLETLLDRIPGSVAPDSDGAETNAL